MPSTKNKSERILKEISNEYHITGVDVLTTCLLQLCAAREGSRICQRPNARIPPK